MSGKCWIDDLGVAAAPPDEAEAKRLLGIPSEAKVRTLNIDAAALFLLWEPDGNVQAAIRCVREDAIAMLRGIADRIEQDPTIQPDAGRRS